MWLEFTEYLRQSWYLWFIAIVFGLPAIWIRWFLDTYEPEGMSEDELVAYCQELHEEDARLNRIEEGQVLSRFNTMLLNDEIARSRLNPHRMPWLRILASLFVVAGVMLYFGLFLRSLLVESFGAEFGYTDAQAFAVLAAMSALPVLVARWAYLDGYDKGYKKGRERGHYQALRSTKVEKDAHSCARRESRVAPYSLEEVLDIFNATVIEVSSEDDTEEERDVS